MLSPEQSKLIRRAETGKATEQDRGALAALVLHAQRLDLDDTERTRLTRAAEKVSR